MYRYVEKIKTDFVGVDGQPTVLSVVVRVQDSSRVWRLHAHHVVHLCNHRYSFKDFNSYIIIIL